MKKFLLGLVIVGTAMGAIPAQAEVRTIAQKSVTFKWVPPCAILCDYGVSSNGYQTACGDPWPEGSYVDLTLKAPKKANFLLFYAYPKVDWDVFLCRLGKTMKYSANGYVDQTGIPEKMGLYIKPGATYVLRAYNYTDTDPLPAKYVFKYVR